LNIDAATEPARKSFHQGAHYRNVLTDLHRLLAPRRYLEIGVNQGLTLALARCRSVGVDPEFILSEDVMRGKPFLTLVQETSDDFFAGHDVAALLGGPPDLVFLDGMHLAEFLLRDFINAEKVSSRQTVIVLYDCLPANAYMARRDRAALPPEGSNLPKLWAGDVWMTLAAIRRLRPDLRIMPFDAPPTGLVLVTNLDPASRVLSDNLDGILADFAATTVTTRMLRDHHAAMQVQSTDSLGACLADAGLLSPDLAMS
jgi:hypothetical protein